MRYARMPFDQLGRVTFKMPPQNLENTARMLQRRVGLIFAGMSGFATAVLAMAAVGF